MVAIDTTSLRKIHNCIFLFADAPSWLFVAIFSSNITIFQSLQRTSRSVTIATTKVLSKFLHFGCSVHCYHVWGHVQLKSRMKQLTVWCWRNMLHCYCPIGLLPSFSLIGASNVNIYFHVWWSRKVCILLLLFVMKSFVIEIMVLWKV